MATTQFWRSATSCCERRLRQIRSARLRVTRAFVPLLRKSKAPRVINVSSGGGQLTGGADGWSPAYCISKTALNGVTSQLASRIAEVRGEFSLPRLGSHGYGRARRYPLSGGGRGHDCVARY